MKTIAVAPVAHVAHPASETGANDGVAPTEDEHGYDLLSIYEGGSLSCSGEPQHAKHGGGDIATAHVEDGLSASNGVPDDDETVEQYGRRLPL